VKGAIETREVITVADRGISLRGTYHKVQEDISSSLLGPNERDHIGMLFLNPGFLPRAADGDSAIYWAESFAKAGYPSFRFDLPGLGDSDGDVPVEMIDFAHLVNTGHYAPTLSALAKSITKRFNLLGVVVVGHCAGAVSAIYAAAASNEIKGLVLLDPYFHLARKSTTIRKTLRFWVPRYRLAGHLSDIYDRLKYYRLLLAGHRLPNNANVSLIRCWNQLASAGLPTIIFTAPKPKPKEGEFDYFRYLNLKSDGSRHVVVKHIEGTNHSFVKGTGKQAFLKHTEQWLSNCFPPRPRTDIDSSDHQRSNIAEMNATANS